MLLQALAAVRNTIHAGWQVKPIICWYTMILNKYLDFISYGNESYS